LDVPAMKTIHFNGGGGKRIRWAERPDDYGVKSENG
jgi:hypothetical protein